MRKKLSGKQAFLGIGLFFILRSVSCKEEKKQQRRRLNEEFYKINKDVPVKFEIKTTWAPIDEIEPDEDVQFDPIPSQMVAGDSNAVAQNDLAQESSIGVDFSFISKPLIFDAIPGPAELMAMLDNDQPQLDTMDGELPRSSKFWYGEEREEEEEISNRRTTSKNAHFKASMNILKYQPSDGTKEIVSGSITTSKEVVDISVFPNGTTAMEITQLGSFPDVDDHEPPNMHDVASQEDLGMHELVGDLDYFEDYEKHHHRQLLRASRRQPSKDSLPNFAKAADLHLQGLERGLSTDANNKVSIDLVVLYTRRAMCAQAYMPPSCEGTMANRAPIEARIMLAMSESNTAYLLSNVYVNLVLKHMELAEDYDDSGAYGEILADFKNRGDGKVDQVHTLRERYKADLAVLVVENSQYCGLGYMFNGNKEYGFSVTSRKCMTGYYSFVHEISHNLVSHSS